jgi:hypothetical protein
VLARLSQRNIYQIMKVGQDTQINLKGSCQPCVSRAQYLFRRTVVYKEAVQMEFGKLHSFLLYPKCKAAIANPKFVHTRVFGMTAASRISSIRQASTPPSSLNDSQVTATMNELWNPNASSAGNLGALVNYLRYIKRPLVNFCRKLRT